MSIEQSCRIDEYRIAIQNSREQNNESGARKKHFPSIVLSIAGNFDMLVLIQGQTIVYNSKVLYPMSLKAKLCLLDSETTQKQI